MTGRGESILAVLGLPSLVRLIECLTAYRTGRRPVAWAAGLLAALAQVAAVSAVAAAVVVLDWRDPQHWSSRRRPCRVCHNPTNLRDERGRPCDKTCAEAELAATVADAAAAYVTGGQAPDPAETAGEVRR